MSDMMIMVLMLVAVFVIPVVGSFFVKTIKVTKSNDYMAGVNVGDDEHFIDSFDNEKALGISNWYFRDMVNEKKWMFAMYWIGAAIIIICMILSVGGAL